MKSKTPLTLMELLVMLLVFSIAAALCVQMFVTADRWSRENERMDRAVLSVQNAAETMKAVSGDLDAAAGLLGGTVSEDTWILHFNEEGQMVAQKDESVYDVIVERLDSDQPFLGTASVTARDQNGENTLFHITVAWQEVERDE